MPKTHLQLTLGYSALVNSLSAQVISLDWTLRNKLEAMRGLILQGPINYEIAGELLGHLKEISQILEKYIFELDFDTKAAVSELFSILKTAFNSNFQERCQ